MYPVGETVRIGDLVWWNGGRCVGFVNSICEPDEITPDSQFTVIGRHPFRAESPGYALGETRFTEIELEDDGIAPMTEVERTEFERAEKIALQTTDTPLVTRYSVTTDIKHHKLLAWIFDFDGPCQPIRVSANMPGSAE